MVASQLSPTAALCSCIPNPAATLTKHRIRPPLRPWAAGLCQDCRPALPRLLPTLGPDGSGGRGSMGFGAEAGSNLCRAARNVPMRSECGNSGRGGVAQERYDRLQFVVCQYVVHAHALDVVRRWCAGNVGLTCLCADPFPFLSR
jgi:hypothetical protein